MAFFASNVARDTSNVAFPTSNISYSLSNYVYSTNTTNVIAAQATANFASNASVFGSNSGGFGSNTAIFGSNTANTANNVAVWSSNNLLTKSGGSITGNLLVTGTTQAQGTLYVGTDVNTTGTYTSGKIMFGGTQGDNGFNHAQIACRKYLPNNEMSELIIAKYNDPGINNSVGPDRIRLRGGAIAFDTYDYYVSNLNDTDADLSTSNIRMYINSEGFVGIGTTTPATELEVDGVITSQYGIQNEGYLYVGTDTTLQGGYTGNPVAFQTHFNYPADGRNYVRGSTIICDTGGSVGIGTTTPASDCKLDVNGITRTSRLRIGSSVLNCTFMDTIIGTVGPASARKVQFTLTNINLPITDYDVYVTPLSADSTKDDVFAVTVMEKTQTKIVVSIYRVDANSGWGQNLKLQYLIIGF
jgi:hypothetical protein